MKVIFAVLADYANVSAEGKLNVMGIFNFIHVSSVPARHTSMNLVMRLQAHPAEYGSSQRVRVSFADADGNRVFNLEGDIAVGTDPHRLGYFDQIIGLNNLPLPKLGDYSFDILVNEQHEFSVPLKVLPLDVAGPKAQNHG